MINTDYLRVGDSLVLVEQRRNGKTWSSVRVSNVGGKTFSVVYESDPHSDPIKFNKSDCQPVDKYRPSAALYNAYYEYKDETSRKNLLDDILRRLQDPKISEQYDLPTLRKVNAVLAGADVF